MSMPFYVSPEQLIKDRADFARKGIARGRSVLVLGYDGGIAFATANPSRALHKVSEIYDRIAFAAVGRYNEFEQLRVAGIRYADLRGYSYDRSDVRARGLANAYAQTLGAAFTTDSKPLEVELVVAEVGASAADDQLYRLSFDGSVADLRDHVVLGGDAEALGAQVAERWRPGLDLGAVLRLAAEVLATDDERATVAAAGLEVAVLERARPRRAFRRVVGPELTALLAPTDDRASDRPSDGATTDRAASDGGTDA